MTGAILVVNSGSSSVKFSIYRASDNPDPALQCDGLVERIGTQPRLVVRNADGVAIEDKAFSPDEVCDHDGAIAAISAWLASMGDQTRLLAAGHRVAHGGAEFAAPALIDDRVLAKLEEFVPLAPLHQRGNLATIRALRSRQPSLLQVACFDTAFHRGHSELADRFALPDQFYREGIRRYGFHGLSYEYVAGELPTVAPEIAKRRVVIAHLGSGASLCAIRDGRSVNSTMSFTALDGVPMGTRCGALDPGVVLFLITQRHMSPAEVEHLLYHECGLLGLSGISNDVRDLEASNADAAKLALDHFAYQVCRAVGALAAELEGLDGIVFTAGIGEHSATLREKVCKRLEWLGLRLDLAANRAGRRRISQPNSAVSALVVPTDEERVIARYTRALIAAG